MMHLHLVLTKLNVKIICVIEPKSKGFVRYIREGLYIICFKLKLKLQQLVYISDIYCVFDKNMSEDQSSQICDDSESLLFNVCGTTSLIPIGSGSHHFQKRSVFINECVIKVIN